MNYILERGEVSAILRTSCCQKYIQKSSITFPGTAKCYWTVEQFSSMLDPMVRWDSILGPNPYSVLWKE